LGFDNEDSAVIDDIVSLGKSMGLEVNNEVGLKQCLLLCVSFFFVIDLMVSIDFVLRTCAQSTVVKV